MEANHQTLSSTLRNLEGAVHSLSTRVAEVYDQSCASSGVIQQLVHSAQREHQRPAVKQRSIAVETSPREPARTVGVQTTDRGTPPSSQPAPSNHKAPSHKSSPKTPTTTNPLTTSRAEKKRNSRKTDVTGLQSDSGSDTSDSDNESVTSSEDKLTNTTSQHQQDDRDPDLPHLLILHDSVLQGVDAERLGRSYGLRVTMHRRPTIESCTQEITSNSPDAILIHTGASDLKTQSAEESSNQLSAAINSLQHQHKKCKFIVSQAITPPNPDLQPKTELHNAFIHNKLYDTQGVSFLRHTNFKSRQHLQDNARTTMKGASILAGNIGRHVENLFWEKPKKKRHTVQSSRQPPREMHENYTRPRTQYRTARHEEDERRQSTDMVHGWGRRQRQPWHARYPPERQAERRDHFPQPTRRHYTWRPSPSQWRDYDSYYNKKHYSSYERY